MFRTLGRSWEFAKLSYGIVWDHKGLLVFPVLSSIAAILVVAAFVLPVWSSGDMAEWTAVLSEEGAGGATPGMYITLFLFYFCTYFVIIFFNSALTACAMKAIAGQTPSVGEGLAMAGRRLPQIVGWALVSATVGVLLRALENAHERVGQIVAAILGMAWTAMAYFVVPVIVMEGLGPVEAFKRSLGTLRKTWGTALVGNFSLGLINFLIMLPVFIVAALIVFAGLSADSTGATVLAIGAAAALVAVAVAVGSAADMVFKSLLYQFANDRPLPAGMDASGFADAFVEKKS